MKPSFFASIANRARLCARAHAFLTSGAKVGRELLTVRAKREWYVRSYTRCFQSCIQSRINHLASSTISPSLAFALVGASQQSQPTSQWSRYRNIIELLPMTSSAATNATLFAFEDIFEITALNPDGKKVFESVNRARAFGLTFECELLLDFNCDIYPLYEGDKFTLVLTSTLHLDGSPSNHFSYDGIATEPSLADNYECVMHGRMYNVAFCSPRNWVWDEVEEEYKCVRGCGCDETFHRKDLDRFVIIAISFGGLLLRLVGDPRHLTGLSSIPDQRLYLLLKKN